MQKDTGAGVAEMAGQPAAKLHDAGALADEAFAAVLLRALVAMAVRSQRRQADLIAALRGAGLEAEPVRVRTALGLLRKQGCIENLVPLSDGGVLLSVTAAAIDRLGVRPRWLPLAEEG